MAALPANVPTCRGPRSPCAPMRSQRFCRALHQYRPRLDPRAFGSFAPNCHDHRLRVSRRAHDGGHRQAHRRALLRPPVSYSYWDGCSTGGRQGLIEAQRFPEDFDGIVDGAPVFNCRRHHGGLVWFVQALEEAQFPCPSSRWSRRALRQMRQNDGIDDGVIDDPRKCDFDPARDVPQCTAGQPTRIVSPRRDPSAVTASTAARSATANRFSSATAGPRDGRHDLRRRRRAGARLGPVDDRHARSPFGPFPLRRDDSDSSPYGTPIRDRPTDYDFDKDPANSSRSGASSTPPIRTCRVSAPRRQAASCITAGLTPRSSR